MDPDPVVVRPSAASREPNEAALFDPDWGSRSAEELRAIVQHGLRDDSFAAAARELERRARTLTYQAEDESVAEQVSHRRLVYFLLGGLAVVAAGGLIVGAMLV